MKFTLERQKQNNSINYLDLTIQKIKINKKYKLNYKIYRKETTSKLSIHYESCHPSQHKLANFRFLLNRLNKIPLSKNNYKKEFNNIISIALFNKIPVKKFIS